MSGKLENFLNGIKTCCPKDILTWVEKHPPKRRAPFIREFFMIAHDLDPEWHRNSGVITNACRTFLFHRRSAISKTTGKPVKEVTVISDYTAVRHYLNRLQKAKKLPSNALIPPITKSSDVFSEKECNILGYLTLEHAVQAASMEIALSEIAQQIEKHRAVILSKCKHVVAEGFARYLKTPDIIRRSDVIAIRPTKDNLDPNLRGFGTGQHISFFSPSHPNGFINSVAYLATEQDGLFTRKSFPGSHHIYSWSLMEIKSYLGITDEFAVAAMCIIIDELGINVIDLANAQVKKTKDGQFVTIREDGGITVTTLKPRANKLIERHAPKASNEIKVDAESIDANTTLWMLLQMRTQHSKALNSNYLFVMDGSSPTRQRDEHLYRILNTRRKSTFKAIIDSLPPWVAEAEPTMPKIRVSRGLLKWIESGGDTLETSLYLGNSLLTALRNYVPPSIQEFVYRKKLRDHQNIQLLIAEEITPYTSHHSGESYEIAQAQLIYAVKQIRATSPQAAESNPSHIIYFLCSPQTIELVVSYATFGKDDNLTSTCKTIITKIQEEGSRKMIKLLADAKPKRMDFDLLEASVNE
ncbi:hypothetical protein [Pseudomonas sp. EggHat1]|uniref:hypothetical protein n=1 Tax=Pseudomonas sp. EggHat1 TaxID=2761624 RepID=UPI001866C0D2|nr:hypothetical protein [Pseudomonas sp. EggHat1]